MELFGLLLLEEFKEKHPTARKVVDVWIAEIRAAKWKNTQSIKERYRSADFLPKNVVLFNIKGNSFRLAAKVDYQRQIVQVVWVGTHAEYDKKKF